MSRHQRFTLIELLVVTVIILILVSMLLPALTEAKERGRRIVCLNQLKQIAVSALMYADDEEGVLPGSRENSRSWDWNSITDSGTHLTGVADLFTLGYVNAEKVFMKCPSRFDRPTSSPTETYVGRQYWLSGFSSYTFAGSTLMPTTYQNSWSNPNSWYWVNVARHDPEHTLTADCVSLEVAASNEGGWGWMRQNNHYSDVGIIDPRVLAVGGNRIAVDGSGEWLRIQEWSRNGQYAEYWPYDDIDAQAATSNATVDAATKYWFVDNNHNTPSGGRRGNFVP